MAYKDKDKQREANKKAMQRLRAKNAGSALSGSGKVSQNAPVSPVVDKVSDTLPVIPSKSVIPCDTPESIAEADKELAASDQELTRLMAKPEGVVWESEPGAATKIAEIASGKGSTDTLGTESESLQHKSGTDTMSVKQGVTGSCAVDYQHNTTGVSPILEPNLKRGKDIKHFENLSPSIQRVIDVMSDDKTEHKRRTAIAINYQHQFPDRYHSTGVV